MPRSTHVFARRPLVAFVTLAYGLSWLVWLPRVAAVRGWWGHERAPLPSLHLAGSLGPALAALVVARAADGTAGLRALIAAVGRWRVGATWWAVAVLGPGAVYAAAALGTRLAGAPGPDVSRLLRVAEYPAFGPLAVVLAEVGAYGLGEETGWRGFAWPRLTARWGPGRAVVVLSAVWAGWHLPLLVSNPTYRAMGVLGLAGWYASLLTGTALTAWLYEGARGSVLVVAVFHALLDVVMVNDGVQPAMVPVMGAIVTLAGVAAFARLAVSARGGPRRGSRPTAPQAGVRQRTASS